MEGTQITDGHNQTATDVELAPTHAPAPSTEGAEAQAQGQAGAAAPVVRQRVPKLVGLFNQGSTCYLNSLLQALYMTSDFRRLVFSWRDSAGASTFSAAGPSAGALKRSVSYQLQLLFARLSLSRSRTAVDTSALTHAFGWNNADNFRQHDVQELMRVLFGALELAWGSGAAGQAGAPTTAAAASPTPRASLSSLYTGTLLDVLQCCSCGARRERHDPFQDLSLSVSGCPSLRESLKAFIAPERMEGDNALRCSSAKCGGTKQPALKGLALQAPLPPILTFQLKRFVFNFELMQRVKLNDAFDFPQRLDMSEFMSGGLGAPVAAERGKGSTGESDATTVPASSTSTSAASSDGSSSSSNTYELFAILMHSGVALGGHYYAYLRSLTDGRFYEFNDACVWELQEGVEGAIKHARGGGGGGAAGKRDSGASAYMLMYRRVDPAQPQGPNKAPGADTTMPAAVDATAPTPAEEAPTSPASELDALLSAEVRELIAAEERQHELDQAAAELERRTLHLTVTYQPPPPAAAAAQPPAAQSASFKLDMGTEVSHLLQQLYSSFSLPPSTPLSSLRLRKFDPTLRWASTIYATGDEVPEGATLESVGLATQKQTQLLLEQKQEGQEWAPYVADTIPLRCVFVTPANLASLVDESPHPRVADEVFLVSARRGGSVAELREAIVAAAQAQAHIQSIPSAANQRLLLLHESSVQLLKDDPASSAPTLHPFDLYPGRWVYVEHALEPEALRPAFERVRCQIEVVFNSPAPPPPPMDSANSVTTTATTTIFQPEYLHRVRVSRNDSLAHLKSLIGAQLGLDPSGFRIARNHTAPQFKDLDRSLAELQLVDQSGVYVSLGRPLGREEVQVKFFLMRTEDTEETEPTATAAAASTGGDSSATASASTSAAPASVPATPPSRFLPLFDLPLRTDTLVSDLKTQLLVYLARRRPHPTDPLGNGWGIRFLRVRDKKGLSSTMVLEDSKTLLENLPKLEDGVELALQKLEAPEVWTKEQLMLQAQQWFPRTQKLGKVEDLVTRKNIGVGGMKAQIERMLHPEGGNNVTTAPAAATTSPAASPAAMPAPTATTSPSAALSSTDSSSSSSAAGAAAPKRSVTPPPGPRIFLAKGKLIGRMKRADALKLAWIGGSDRSVDGKLLRNALALRSGELLMYYEEETAEEKAALDAAKEKKTAAAAAAAAAGSSADGTTPASAAASTSAAAPLKPWQRGGALRARKPASSSGAAAPSRPPPVEHGLRIGLTPEQEAECARREAEEEQQQQQQQQQEEAKQHQSQQQS